MINSEPKNEIVGTINKLLLANLKNPDFLRAVQPGRNLVNNSVKIDFMRQIRGREFNKAETRKVLDLKSGGNSYGKLMGQLKNHADDGWDLQDVSDKNFKIVRKLSPKKIKYRKKGSKAKGILQKKFKKQNSKI